MAKLVVAGNVIGDLETVNSKSPDANGNVKLSGDDLLVHVSGTTTSVGTAIDNVKTTADAAVKKVNGQSPDASGNATVAASQIGTSATGVTVQAALDGKVKSVNGTAPTSGNIALSGENLPYAADTPNWTIKQEVDEITDKLPNRFLISVNDQTPDPDGNVELWWDDLKTQDGTRIEDVIVKSVNGVLPQLGWDNNVVLAAGDVPMVAGQTQTVAQKFTAVDTTVGGKVDKTSVVQVEGDSTTNVISQAAVSGMLSDIRDSIVNMEFQTVSQLPTTGQSNVIYLQRDESQQSGPYTEYCWLESESRFEMIGTTEIDLTPYLEILSLAAATGQSTQTAMTQKATTDALGLKADSSKFQVVATLPSTPDPNVWYVVTG
ncbi:MAG: hypothetical protein LBK54_10250 [Propionibacteriaceae bacterium]|jgi:hypothetical protein|nr:hypothetical protein [Propionibacteriaceae bacterium]